MQPASLGVMGYELDLGLSSTDAIRAVASERLERAHEQLTTRPEGLDEAVHEARKDLKRFRALARLVRGALPRATYRRANGMARDAGRELSELRDATALLETVDALDEVFGSAVREPVTAPLRAALEADRERFDDDELERGVRAALERLEVLSGREVEGWSFDEELPEAWRDGLLRTYRRARSSMQVAREQPTSENLHEWRKRVKYHRYHLKLVRACWPRVVQGQRKEVKALSQLLGDDHDLAVLAERLRGDAFDPGLDRDLLNALILERRARLQEDAFAMGELAFAEAPKALAKRLGGYAARRRHSTRTTHTVEDIARV